MNIDETPFTYIDWSAISGVLAASGLDASRQRRVWLAAIKMCNETAGNFKAEEIAKTLVENEKNKSTFETAKEKALREGYKVDTTCYPWIKYKGPRFRPTEWGPIDSDEESELAHIRMLLVDVPGVGAVGRVTTLMGWYQELCRKYSGENIG